MSDNRIGEIAPLGRMHGAPTPASAVVQRLGGMSVRNGERPGDDAVDQVCARIQAEGAGGPAEAP